MMWAGHYAVVPGNDQSHDPMKTAIKTLFCVTNENISRKITAHPA
jgi:hypothetical protein